MRSGGRGGRAAVRARQHHTATVSSVALPCFHSHRGWSCLVLCDALVHAAMWRRTHEQHKLIKKERERLRRDGTMKPLTFLEGLMRISMVRALAAPSRDA